ncbi:hypothetical protein [Bremerella cremea]|uniref:hypothetical protein n=1 Tax=Bremerella cremea TaxID=1031537 RepID=UPI0031E63B6B
MENQPTKLRWFNFRLGTLLVAIAVICIGIVFLGKPLYQARVERIVIAEFDQSHGWIKLQSDGEGKLAHLNNIGVLGLVDDDVLLLLPSLPQLETLQLGSNVLTDDSAKALGKIPNLKRLVLRNTLVTPEQMASIARSPSIRSIEIEGRTATDANIELLAKFPNLEHVSICNSEATDASIETLAGAPHLARLGFMLVPNMTSSSLESLATLPKLEDLTVKGTQLSDEGLRMIGQMQSLRSLAISPGPKEPFSEAGLKSLASLKHLTTFEIFNPAVDGRSMPTLATFPELTTLVFDGTSITHEDATEHGFFPDPKHGSLYTRKPEDLPASRNDG